MFKQMSEFFCPLIMVIWLCFLQVSAQVTDLPVVFFSYGQLTGMTSIIQWLTLVQCEDSTANLPMIQITLIQPENPSFDPTRAFTIAEVSSCSNSFAASCIIGVNYVKNGGQMIAYNNITIPYNSSLNNLAIRYKSQIGYSPLAVHLTYISNSPIVSGQYDFTVFNTNNVPPSSPTNFGQYVKLDTSSSVLNSQYKYYYTAFCEKDIVINSQNYYTVNIHVSSVDDTPLAAFDLVGCSAQDIPDYEEDCTLLNDNNPAVVMNENAASIVSVTLNSQNMDLSEGIWIGVYGYGGELSGNNEFLLSLEEQSYSSPNKNSNNLNK